VPHLTSGRTLAATAVLAVLLVVVVVAWYGRSASARIPAMPGADAGRGAHWIEGFGCGSCHTIDGIDGADAHVGPPLVDLARRRVIAGKLPNTPQNLTRWIAHPQQVDPGNVMPDLGLTDQQAADIALYLYRHS
jgi:cytochrome c